MERYLPESNLVRLFVVTLVVGSVISLFIA